MKVGFIGGKFLPLHLGHVYAITTAATLVDKLYVVLSHSNKRDRELCRRDGVKYMPPQQRMSWLAQLAKDLPHVKPIAVEDEYGDADYDWERGARDIKQAIPESIDYVFGSEESYRPLFEKLYPTADYVIIDSARKRVPVSATMLRKDIYTHWEFLPDIVKPFFVKKVVVVGTESCGKSTLINNLALLYNTQQVKEFGREVCADAGGAEYLASDMYPYIAYGHKMREYEAMKRANKLVFVDTEALVTKYYGELYANVSTKVFDEIARLQDYDLWLFLEPDVAWVADGQRLHGQDQQRQENNKVLKFILKEQKINYVSISGNYNERFTASLKEVDALFT